MQKIKNFIKDEKGQALSEYGLIIGLIAVVAIGAISLFGEQIKKVFTDITAKLNPTKAADPATPAKD